MNVQYLGDDKITDKVIAPDALPEDMRNPTPKMPDIKVSVAGIVNLLKNLKPKRVAGPDRITRTKRRACPNP